MIKWRQLADLVAEMGGRGWWVDDGFVPYYGCFMQNGEYLYLCGLPWKTFVLIVAMVAATTFLAIEYWEEKK